MICHDEHTPGRTCTQPDGHPLPHRDDLGTWVHLHEHHPDDQARIRAMWAEMEDQ